VDEYKYLLATKSVTAMEGYNNSYQNTSSGRETEFQRLAQNIGTNIQKIQQNVSSMQRMITHIDGPQDNTQLQSQLHQIQHYTQQLAKDSSKQLQELNSYAAQDAADPRQWKLQRERLQADFTRALDNFQRAQRSAAQKEKEAIKKYKNTAGGQTDLIDIEAAGGGGGGRTQMMLQEEQQNLEHLIERERAVTQLEADIMDVNQIFKDLAAMVHDQGELVDSIEANVETSSIRVSEGTEQLRQAERYQNKARKKKMILAIIGVVVLVIIISIIVHSTSN